MKHETIGTRIQRKRKAKGWTPFRLSLAAKLPEQSIRGWEKGRTPNAESIPALAQALDTSSNYLLTGKEQAAKPRTQPVSIRPND